MKTLLPFILLFIAVVQLEGQIQLNSKDEIELKRTIDINNYSMVDSSKIRVWIENGWVNAERSDKDNELIWRVVVYKFLGNNYPKVTSDKSQIEIASPDGRYYLTNTVVPFTFIRHEILRGVQEINVLDNSMGFEPSKYKVTTADSISKFGDNLLLAYEKNGWRFVSLGKIGGDKVVGLIRMQHNLVETEKWTKSTEGLDILGDHHLFWDTRMLYAEQVPNAYFQKTFTAYNELSNKPAPELNVIKKYNNYSFTSLKELKGKIAILYFWATWCSPCQKSMPQLETLQAKYADKGLVVIGIHSNEYNEDVIDRYLFENRNIKFPICVVDEKTITTYMSESVPKYYIIGRDGNILKSLLNNLPSEEEILRILNGKEN